MASIAYRDARWAIHPLHAVLLASALPLFLGGLLSDLAYGASYEIQWSIFAAWLIAGGMVFIGLAFLWALVDLVRARRSRGMLLIYFLVLLAILLFGLLNSFAHARDAWAMMPDGPILSTIVTLLTIVAVWIGFASLHAGARR